MFSCSKVKNNKDCKTLTIGTTTAITPTRTKTLSIGTNNINNTNKYNE